MRFVRYGAVGAEKPGVLDAEGAVRDLSNVVADLAGDVLVDLPGVDPETLPLVAGNPRLGPPVGQVGKIVCIGLNYSDHAEEAGMQIPTEPIVFMKATSAIIGARDTVEMPRGSTRTDWEVELGVIIGKPAKYVDEAEALRHVAGYCIANDVSERELQIEHLGQWTKGKSCDTFAPLGPWMVTPDEVGDVQALDLMVEVNGARMQTGNSSSMIFTVAQVIAYLSKLMTLHPGDVIMTGTPPGVGMGMKPPRYLKAGDEMVLEISKLGQQRLQVAQG